MKVGELKQMLEAWHDDDEVEVSVPLLAETQGCNYSWLELLDIDNGFNANPPGKNLCLINAGEVIGSN